MLEVRVPAFHEDGELVTLHEILRAVGLQEGWKWRLLNFEGTSRTDSKLNVLALQRMVSDSREGVDYSWPDLLGLTAQVDQAIDVTIIATSLMGRCVLVLEARDGTYWRILAEKDERGAVAAARRAVFAAH